RLRGATDVRRVETGAFDQNVAGLLVNFRVLSAHHPGKGDGLLFVGNEQHFVRQLALVAIERGESLALLRAANDDRWNLAAANVRRRIAGVPLLALGAACEQ